jgi:hypothetical protein
MFFLYVRLVIFILLCSFILIGVGGVFGLILLVFCAFPFLFLFALL